jgi:hypothetical protein
MWADDNRHLCGIDRGPNAVTLITQLPGEAVKTTVTPHDSVGRTVLGGRDIELAACSFRNDRAIALIGSDPELLVIRISDGALLSRKIYQREDVVTFVASRDAVYLAENSRKSQGVVSGAASTVIRRVSDGQQVKALDPWVRVLAFSGDDSRVLAISKVVITNTSGAIVDGDVTVELIQWTTGVRVWTHGESFWMDTFLPQSDGGGFAIASRTDPFLCNIMTSTTCHQGEPGSVVVAIIRGDGTQTMIPGSYVLTFYQGPW